jgi:UDP-N-acetylmuramoyl-tripeptide--D-alanyl-D-alanine ligase
MRPRSLSEIAAATGGKVVGDGSVRVGAVSTDSRSLAPGDLFVALRGPRFDGHRFAAAAAAAGAAAVLVEVGAGTVEPRVEVTDTLAALRDLAVRARDDLALPVVAVTGSSGKTTTKDLLAAALPGSHVPRGSYNNEVGVPLTVLACPADAAYLVLEVGSRGPGHIAHLASVVRPDVAIVTNIGVAHMEMFGTRERLLEAKGELVDALGAGGTAIVPVSETALAARTPGAVVTFGDDPAADVAVTDLSLDASGFPAFTLRTPAGSVRLRLPLAGAHQALNAAAAMGAGIALGIDPETLAGGMERAGGSPWRMEVHRGRFTVIDDSYNANPDSMAAALRTAAAVPGRHVAVLGEMAELGHIAAAEHERIGRLVRELGFVAVVVVGSDPGLVAGAGPIARPVADAAAAAAVVSRIVRDGDVVLVKASRAVGLEAVARGLVEEATS